jgi:hypothetical protein
MHPAAMAPLIGKYKLAQVLEIREQRSENRDQRTEIKDQRTEIKDQRTEIREQRTENRERGTGNREQKSGIAKFTFDIETKSTTIWLWIN